MKRSTSVESKISIWLKLSLSFIPNIILINVLAFQACGARLRSGSMVFYAS